MNDLVLSTSDYGAAGTYPATGASERARTRIVALVVVIFLLLIAEGAMRKWLLPSYGRYLFFIRDPFVIAAYAMALTSGWWPKQRGFLTFGLGFAALCLLVAPIQLMSRAAAESQLLLAFYGWRNYFLYLPLAFLIGETFRRRDIALVARLTLLLSVPIAMLAFAQFFAPLGSPINVGISDDVALQFKGLTLTGTRTRPMGPFTSDVGQREFTVMLTATVLALWIMNSSKRFVAVWQLAIGTGAAFTCLAIGGSRGAMVHVGILMIAAVASAVVTKAGAATVRTILIPTVLSIMAVALFPVLFPEGLAAFTERWEGAAQAESQQFQFGVFGRALYGFVDFFRLLGSTPVFGYGLGLAGNASILLGVQIEGFSGWAETDWARHIVDLGPVLGLIFIGFRIALVGWLLQRVLVATRVQGDPLALLLFAFAGLELLQGQLTGHGTVNGFTWIFVGLALAATAPAPDEGPNPSVLEIPRFPNLMR